MSGQALRIAVRRFGPFESAIRKEWQSFSRDHRTDLEMEAVALDLPDLHRTLFAEQGLLRGTWDVAFLPTDWVAEAHEAAAVIDLAPFLQNEPPPDYPEGWPPSLLRFQRFGNRVLGIPYHDGPECLLCRTDVLAELRLPVPSTWTEFHDVARAVAKGRPGLAGAILAGYPDGHNTVYDLCLQLWTRGGDLFSPEGRLTLCTPEAESALTFYRDLFRDGQAMHSRAAEMDSVEAGWAFARGEGALSVNWFGFAAMCESVPESRVKGLVGVHPLPVEPAGTPSASLNVYWMLAVGAGCTRPELAYRFLRHCAGPENDRLLALEGGIGCRRSTWQDAEVNRVIPFYHRLEELHRNARELPRVKHLPELAKLLDELTTLARQSDEPVAELLDRFQRRAVARDF